MSSPRLERQRGAGVIGTSAGFLVFLLLLLVAVQVLFNLYANTMVSAAAHDAARSVAAYRDGSDSCEAVDTATQDFVSNLGGYHEAASVTLRWDCARADAIAVEVSARHPTILPQRMRGLLGLGEFERIITVHREGFQQ